MEKIGTTIKNNMRQYAMLIALVVIMIFFQIATNGVLLYPMNVTNLVLQNSYVLILAIGMTLCILTGGNIDLSVGSVCAFVGAISGTLMINMKMPMLPALLITLGIGFIIGLWQGFWIAYIRIPAFIVTLAGMLIFRGLTNTILQGLTLAPYPKEYQMISGGFIPDFLNFFGAGFNVTTIVVGVVLSLLYVFMALKKRKERAGYGFENTHFLFFIIQCVVVVGGIMLLAYWLAAYKGIPIIFVIIGTLVFGYTVFTQKTVPGRYIYAMGGNEKAAQLSGINTNKVLFFTYVNMSVLAAIAGISFSSRINSASPVAGQNFELDAIAACFIGGASAYGGVGTVIGAIIGALVMGVLNNGMSIMGVGIDMQMTIKGLVLLVAVAFDVISKRKSRT
ncbi:multiple monosaccharide ABC transporter permease [Thermoclostridium caenicola]|uniref:Xylose transport system permease protein XylH n=1 Tax=Thermoclostridium caenicola TaxID=659425 RepID=A0A1M6B6R7_9FIRM|nr:multiple monosaccharide ABC transporter permease [Thermoclostridium caenicola]SHI44405.1 multiple monosaccharide ABC transporter membrane protein [Thermoclostridium caenicola]HOP71909.1 sugar ABC transporter permease [Thermoclostridium caenicola]HPU22422.1 sugar ABC transporter permease [Thermoclostridium caenicola]